MPGFCHLHCHTQYSLLDGAARIESLVEKASRLGIPALGITDHGNLFGVPEFFTRCRQHKIQPILGCEFYMAPSGMDDRTDRTRYHQVLLAMNETGYRNLIKLSSLSYTRGYYYKPRIDLAALRSHSEGLIATTCCLQGEIPQTLLKRGEDAARKILEAYLDIFGGHYYIEIQDHGIAEQRQVNAVLERWAREYSIPVIATNDVHYVDEADAEAQDVLLCLQTGKDLTDPNRMRFENNQFFLKSREEMAAAFTGQDARLLDRAFDTTLEIADKCTFELPMGKLLMPHYPLPREYESDMEGYLKHLVFEGARRRYDPLTQDVIDRINFELNVIRQMGYAGYFLIVQDFTTAARELNVRVGPGRGSAAGSAVAYCLGITNIDPLKYDLLFERFLNPERISMPDIDIDFDDRGRSKVIDYVVKKYGRDNVCQIITFGTMGARSVIRDVSRVLGIPLSESDRIAKLIPEGPKSSLEKALAEVPEFRQLSKHEDELKRKLIQFATVLEGSARHTGVHAAGVIIAPGRVSDYVPVSTAKGKGGAEDVVVTQYDGKWIEEFGLLKMDFLGLKTLTVLNDTIALISENHGVEIDIDEIPLDDEKTFDLFKRGETVAIFQFESDGMREWLRKLKPTAIDDLIAMNALYRPGPMDLIPLYIDRKHGREPVDFPHEMLKPILEPTYGIPVYQEQVMQMAQVMADYSLGGADLLRRAMGKKKIQEMEKQRAIFVEGAAGKGVSADKANEVFNVMEKFAGYGFNKCLAGDTQIIDALTGERTTIESLFRARRNFTVHALGEDRRLAARRVADVVWNGRKPVFELTTTLGHRIRATGNHPFRTLNGWTQLAHLKPGDRIAAARHLPVPTQKRWPKHELIVLAGLISEGNTCHPSSLCYYNNEISACQDFAQAVGAFPDTVARVDRRADGRFEVCANTGQDARFQKGQRPWNAADLPTEQTLVRAESRVARAGAYRWAESLNLTGRKAAEKRVPGEIFRLRDDDIRFFLGRLWSGDGFIANAKHAVPFYATSSSILARDVQTLLLRVGIISRIHTKQFKYRGGIKRGYTVSLLGDDSLLRFDRDIVPHTVGRENGAAVLNAYLRATERDRSSKDTIPGEIRNWINEEREAAGLTWQALEQLSGVSMKEFTGAGSSGKRGFRRSTIAKLAVFFASRRLADIAASDVFWDRIVSIDPKGVLDTYDLTVEEDHNFVAEGLIVHNSHSAAYSVVAYQTAYLKAHYPAEFMAAVMTNEMGDAKKLAVVLDEARRMSLSVLPPSINRSQAHFTVDAEGIRFGLAAIKGVGVGAIECITRARKNQGPFTSIFELCKRVDLRAVGKKTLECLARAGALDDFGGHRAQMVEAVDDACRYGQKIQSDRALGQSSLFGALKNGSAEVEPPLPSVEPWSRSEMLKNERELIGFYLSGHPLESFAPEVKAFATARFGRPDEIDSERPQTFCGIITGINRHTTRQGRPMAFVTIEDFTGQGEIVLFSEQYERNRQLIEVDELIMVKGVAEIRGGGVKVRGNEILPMWRVRDQMVRGIIVRVDSEAVPVEKIDRLKSLCEQNRGKCRLYFDVSMDDAPEPIRLLSRNFVVDPTPDLMQGISELFGTDNIRITAEA